MVISALMIAISAIYAMRTIYVLIPKINMLAGDRSVPKVAALFGWRFGH